MEIKSTELFTPLADDKFAAALPLHEIATVKPSGYLQPRGIVSENNIPDMVAQINAYYTAQERDLPKVYVRPVGATGWLLIDEIVTDVPDELPADFS